jgi:hypothetical protein
VDVEVVEVDYTARLWEWVQIRQKLIDNPREEGISIEEALPNAYIRQVSFSCIC